MTEYGLPGSLRRRVHRGSAGERAACSPRNRVPRRVALALVAFASILVAGARTSSAQAIPAAIPQAASSRLEIDGAYGYFNPTGANAEHYLSQPAGSVAIAGLTGYFSRFLGVEAEGSVSAPGTKPCVYDVEAGPRLRLPVRSFVPYVHVLAGGSKLGGPVGQRCTWGWGVTGGGGLDYVLPFGRGHLAARLVQVDYAYSHVMFPHPESALVTGGLVRLSTGLVIRAGTISAPAAKAMSCPVEPANVFAGDPVSVTAETVGDLGKGQPTYRWSVGGGKINGGGETVTIDTAGLPPGDYEVSGKLTARNAHRLIASCRSSFRVRGRDPLPDPVKDALTLTCAAQPSRLSPGGSAVITALVDDPLHRKLRFSYSATAGTLDGTSDTVNLTLSPLAAGTVEVSCGVADDLGRTAVFKLVLPVMQAPPPPVAAAATAPAAPIPAPLPPPSCSIAFPDDRGRAVRLNADAKACLDALAIELERQPGTRVVLLGHHLPPETPATAAQRTVTSALYLTLTRHIDPARVEMRTGGEPDQAVQTFVLQPGQIFASDDSSPIDTNSLKQDGRELRTPRR